MRRLFQSLAAATVLFAWSSDLAPQSVTLRAGTIVRCTLEEPNFSSRTAQIGEPVICYLQPLREFGYSVFPRGSYLTGRFVDYEAPGRFVGKGWMKREFDRLINGPNTEIPIAGKVVGLRKYRTDAEGRIVGRGHPKRDAFFWTIPILWPIKLVTLPARGPHPTLKGEIPITLRLLDDVEIPICHPRSKTLSGANRAPALGPTRDEDENDAKPRPRRIPILENLKDLAYHFIGDTLDRTDLRTRVEDVLGRKE